ncbi:EVE domain-containing protein [Teredinibacter haidensis]|uniref:EVE domain-containing protein n=1 Tax=Teredinibacter haidensis TaxID=2731755 RepID=UPI0009488B8A|nr:EVE domain-containing protein [Teredinibacter haidensis]
MRHWLFKTEPDEYSILDLSKESDQTGRWDGIRNYQSRNFIRDSIKTGDQVLIYHSNCKPTAIEGVASVVRSAYPDPAQFEHKSAYYDAKSLPESPRWFCVDIHLEEQFTHAIPMAQIKNEPALKDMVLLKQPRLSIQPVTTAEFKKILTLTKSRRD